MHASVQLHQSQFNFASCTIVKTLYEDALGFFDNSSTITLITRSFDEQHNLKGVNITYELITVGKNVQIHHTILYTITLLDKDGNAHMIQAYQIESICKISPVEIDVVASSFPSRCQTEISESGDDRVVIDLMIGMMITESCTHQRWIVAMA